MATEDATIQELTPEEIYAEMRLMRGRMETLRERLDKLSVHDNIIGWKSRAAEAAYAASSAVHHAYVMVESAYRLAEKGNGK